MQLFNILYNIKNITHSLLISTEEDNELPIRISPDIPEIASNPNGQNNLGSLEFGEAEETTHSEGLFTEGNNIYAYEEPDEDVNLFVNPTIHSERTWKHQFRPLKTFRFWAAVIGWVGIKASILFFWILLPVLSHGIQKRTYIWISVSTMAGFITFFPSLVSFKVLEMTSQNRRLYFGLASWLCGITLIGM